MELSRLHPWVCHDAISGVDPVSNNVHIETWLQMGHVDLLAM